NVQERTDNLALFAEYFDCATNPVLLIFLNPLLNECPVAHELVVRICKVQAELGVAACEVFNCPRIVCLERRNPLLYPVGPELPKRLISNGDFRPFTCQSLHYLAGPREGCFAALRCAGNESLFSR